MNLRHRYLRFRNWWSGLFMSREELSAEEDWLNRMMELGDCCDE